MNKKKKKKKCHVQENKIFSKIKQTRMTVVTYSITTKQLREEEVEKKKIPSLKVEE